MNKGLIVKQDNIFSKIKNFFRKLFFKEKIKDSVEQENTNQYTPDESHNTFFDSIKIKEDEEENRIFKLQKDLEIGKIAVEDITDDDFDKIIELYNKQILKIKSNTDELNKSTEFYKEKIICLRKELKNSNL